MKKTLLTVFIIAIILMQFYRPAKNQSALMPATDLIVMTAPPKPVENLLKNACYDCHSNNTRYPWYANVAPVSYFLANHIEEGKEHLNFSVWGDYSPKRRDHKLEEIIEEVSERQMPIKSYTWLHGNAKLSAEDIQTLTEWAKQLRVSVQPADE
jgi:hypothetical protein